jgi:hypothetical protein
MRYKCWTEKKRGMRKNYSPPKREEQVKREKRVKEGREKIKKYLEFDQVWTPPVLIQRLPLAYNGSLSSVCYYTSGEHVQMFFTLARYSWYHYLQKKKGSTK